MLYSAANSRMVAFVGLLNRVEETPGSLLSEYLADERLLAAGQYVSVAEIAFNASTRLGAEFPWYKRAAYGCATLGAIIELDEPQASATNEAGMRAGFAVEQVFNGSGSVQLMLTGARGQAVVRVYDIRGRELWSTTVSVDGGGYGRCEWNGEDFNGRPAASGVYLLSVDCGGMTSRGKAVLVR
jgi:hypothetical protein